MMTKLEKLKAAWDATNTAYSAALDAEYACDAAADAAVSNIDAACAAARDASNATYAAYAAARDAYQAELKKVQQENSNEYDQVQEGDGSTV